LAKTLAEPGCFDAADGRGWGGGDEEAVGVAFVRLVDIGDDPGKSYTSESSEGSTNGYDVIAEPLVPYVLRAWVSFGSRRILSALL